MCAQIRKHQIEPVKACDVSFQFNRCRCRCFDFNSWSQLPLNQCKDFGPVEGSKPVNFPLEECEGISGFDVKDIATKIRPHVQALYTIKGNACATEKIAQEEISSNEETPTAGGSEAEVLQHEWPRQSDAPGTY